MAVRRRGWWRSEPPGGLVEHIPATRAKASRASTYRGPHSFFRVGWGNNLRTNAHALSILLRRIVDIPAGRVQPGAEYPRFVAFTQQADALLEKEIALGR